jgi:hypothetical protein
MNDADAGAVAAHVADLVRQISPILHGHQPQVIGAVLADLTAMWLAGHPNYLREEILEQNTGLVRELIEPNEAIQFGDAGHPFNEPLQ